MERKTDVNTELRKFLLFNCKYARDESNFKIFEYATIALNILRALPTCRFAVLDYFMNVFEEATNVHLKTDPGAKPGASVSDAQTAYVQLVDVCNTAMDDFVRCIQELLEHNPICWTDVLFNWSIETFVRCFDTASRIARPTQPANGGTPTVANKTASVGTVRSLRVVLDLLVTALRCADEQLRDATLFERALERLFAVASANVTAFDALVTHVGTQFGDQLVDRAMLLTLKDFEWPPPDGAAAGRGSDSRRFASLFAILNGDRQACTIRRLIHAVLFGVPRSTGSNDSSANSATVGVQTSEALNEFVQHRLCLPFVGHLAAQNDAVCAAFSEQLVATLLDGPREREHEHTYASLRARFVSWRLNAREADTLYNVGVHFLVRSVALTDRFELVRFLLDAASSRQLELQRVANRLLVELCLSLERNHEGALLRVGDGPGPGPDSSSGSGRRPKTKTRQDAHTKAVHIFLRAVGESSFLLELLKLLMRDAASFYTDSLAQCERRRFAYVMVIMLNAVASAGRAPQNSRRLAAAALRFLVQHGDAANEAHWRLFAHVYSELRTRCDAQRVPYERALLRVALCAGLLADSDLPTLDCEPTTPERLVPNLVRASAFLLEHERALDDAELLHAVAHCARCLILRLANGPAHVQRVRDTLDLLVRTLNAYIADWSHLKPVRLHLFDAAELHRLVGALIRFANRALVSPERLNPLLTRVCDALRLLNHIARPHLQPTLLFALLNNVYLANRSAFDDTPTPLSLAPVDDLAFDYYVLHSFRSADERSATFDKLRKRTVDGTHRDDATGRRNRAWLLQCVTAVADDERGVELLGTLLCEAILADRVCLFAAAPSPAFGWTDECLVAPSKYTLESDLDVRRQLDVHTVRSLLEFISRRRFALLTVLPLLHAALSVLVSLFDSTALQSVTEMQQELQLTEFLLLCLTRNGLLAPPLTHCAQLLRCVSPNDVGAILRTVRDFLREKRRALFEARSRGTQCTSPFDQVDNTKYKDVLQTLVHAHIDQLGHLFHLFV